MRPTLAVIFLLVQVAILSLIFMEKYEEKSTSVDESQAKATELIQKLEELQSSLQVEKDVTKQEKADIEKLKQEEQEKERLVMKLEEEKDVIEGKEQEEEEEVRKAEKEVEELRLVIERKQKELEEIKKEEEEMKQKEEAERKQKEEAERKQKEETNQEQKGEARRGPIESWPMKECQHITGNGIICRYREVCYDGVTIAVVAEERDQVSPHVIRGWNNWGTVWSNNEFPRLDTWRKLITEDFDAEILPHAIGKGEVITAEMRDQYIAAGNAVYIPDHTIIVEGSIFTHVYHTQQGLVQIWAALLGHLGGNSFYPLPSSFIAKTSTKSRLKGFFSGYLKAFFYAVDKARSKAGLPSMEEEGLAPFVAPLFNLTEGNRFLAYNEWFPEGEPSAPVSVPTGKWVCSKGAMVASPTQMLRTTMLQRAQLVRYAFESNGVTPPELLVRPTTDFWPCSKVQMYMFDRSSNRNFGNKDEILAALEDLQKEYGFQFTYKGDIGYLPFIEQVQAFSEADIILVPHGQNSANAMFAKPSAIIIEVYPYNNVLADYHRHFFVSSGSHFILQVGSDEVLKIIPPKNNTDTTLPWSSCTTCLDTKPRDTDYSSCVGNCFKHMPVFPDIKELIANVKTAFKMLLCEP